MTTTLNKEMILDGDQKLAVERCLKRDLDHRIVAVTGPAGTGKTTIIKMVYDKLLEEGEVPVLCAPTGKAARRIKETTGIDAVTIHKLLAFPMPTDIDEKTGKPLDPNYPQRNKYNPIHVPETSHNEVPTYYTVVLVDEFAMVGHKLYGYLLDAMPKRSYLRVFGDINQLPPVEEKADSHKDSVFSGLLNNKHMPSVYLRTLHRQGEGSAIVAAGERILSGTMPRQVPNEFSMKAATAPLDALLEYVQNSEQDFSQNNCQVIVPGRKKWHGCIAVSNALQNWYQRKATQWYEDVSRYPWDEQDGNTLRLTIGDKVIWTKNDYLLGLMNGEQGIVTNIDFATGLLTIDFNDRVVEVPPVLFYNDIATDTERMYNPQRNIDLAYAITTHKCQGSEYDHIVYFAVRSASFLLNRNNYYTAITRAKKSAMVIGDQAGLSLVLRMPRKG